ncbi:MAG: pseudouridine-5'-phosphate glycosidase [Planctomycetota bacterium]
MRLDVVNRLEDPARAVALETTLLAHGVPRGSAMPLAGRLADAVRAGGAEPALVGLIGGRPMVGLDDDDLRAFLEGTPAKVSLSNLTIAMHRREDAATTVSTTATIAAQAGVRVFATGGLGGVHRGYGESLDVSSDLLALSRTPIVVVASGVKAILDVPSTREALETLGVPVVGWRTDRFPGFYLRDGGAGVDGRFDSIEDLAAFCGAHLSTASSAVLVCNPVPAELELDAGAWASWLESAEIEASEAEGRDRTPLVLAALHRLSGGETLRANLGLVESNAGLAGGLAAKLPA